MSFLTILEVLIQTEHARGIPTSFTNSIRDYKGSDDTRLLVNHNSC